MGEINLRLYSANGLLLEPSLIFSALEWALEENTFGVLRASGPLAEIDPSYFVQDARLEVLRSVDGKPFYVEGDTQFLLKYWDLGEDENGAETWNIEAYSLDYLVTGRMVDSFASTEGDTNPLTTKTDQADDMMKAIVSQNMIAASEATRNISTLTVAPDLAAAPSTTKSFAHRVVFDVLSELAQDSAGNGTYLSWAITGTGSAAVFRTFTHQRGIDHTRGTDNEVIVSKTMGNLTIPRLSYDHRNEYTAVRIGGEGQGRARATVRVIDATRSAATPFSYREKFIENSQTSNTTILTADARAELEASRPLRQFFGRLIDTEYARYGERVRFGDLVTAEYMGFSFACRVARVRGGYDRDGAETLTIDLYSSEAL